LEKETKSFWRRFPEALWVGAALGLVVVTMARHRRDYLVDDALIYARFAENLAAGAGWSYNPPDRVSACTSVLFPLLLALGVAAGVPAEAGAHLLYAIGAWALALGAYAALRPAGRPAAAAAALQGFALARAPRRYRLAAEYAAAGDYVRAHAGPDDAVAAAEIGYVGYHARRRVVDVHGLVHPGTLGAIARGEVLWWWPGRPRFVVAHAEPRYGEPDVATLRAGGCEPLASFGDAGAVVLWGRTDGRARGGDLDRLLRRRGGEARSHGGGAHAAAPAPAVAEASRARRCREGAPPGPGRRPVRVSRPGCATRGSFSRVCIFVSEAAIEPAKTRIFASTRDGLATLAYAMHLGASPEAAMVLPLPVMRGAGAAAVTFVDLERYPELFDDLERGFPRQLAVGPPGFENDLCETLPVQAVGAFEATFVPSAREFGRLDRRFRLPERVWRQLSRYEDYAFAVFRLAPGGARSIHPMALQFSTGFADRIFFPTVHVHDGAVRAEATFDHALYYQRAPDRVPFRDELPSGGAAATFVDVGRAGGLVDPGRPVFRHDVRGRRPNRDFFVVESARRAADLYLFE
jgi:hypothetical protein